MFNTGRKPVLKSTPRSVSNCLPNSGAASFELPDSKRAKPRSVSVGDPRGENDAAAVSSLQASDTRDEAARRAAKLSQIKLHSGASGGVKARLQLAGQRTGKGGQACRPNEPTQSPAPPPTLAEEQSLRVKTDAMSAKVEGGRGFQLSRRLSRKFSQKMNSFEMLDDAAFPFPFRNKIVSFGCSVASML